MHVSGIIPLFCIRFGSGDIDPDKLYILESSFERVVSSLCSFCSANLSVAATRIVEPASCHDFRTRNRVGAKQREFPAAQARQRTRKCQYYCLSDCEEHPHRTAAKVKLATSNRQVELAKLLDDCIAHLSSCRLMLTSADSDNILQGTLSSYQAVQW